MQICEKIMSCKVLDKYKKCLYMSASLENYRFLCQAALGGCDRAQHHLGWWAFVTCKNKATSYWLKKTANQGNIDAVRLLEKISNKKKQ